MSVTEKNALIRAKGATGDSFLIYPITKAENVDGLNTVLDEKIERFGITPQEYGAKGDGTTDDTSAFQSVLAENRCVYVPGGTYKLSGELVIGQNCQLKLAQDVLLEFTQTTGNCISMKASSSIVGGHGAIKVPYEFEGRVINIYAGLDESVVGVPPFSKWGPMWMAARYITDLHIVKLDYRGVAQSVDGTCSGTAVYLGANTNDSMNFLWAVDLTRLRISGAFSYGIHLDTVSDGMSGWIHQTKISAFIDGAEVGVYAKDSTLSYLSTMVIPRRALTTDGTYVPYAKWGICLENCTDVDLSGARVMDWNATYSLWSEGGINQHLALIGDCSGAILNEHYYYASEKYDIRSLIYTDTPSNLERLTILQEPITRWFKPVDGAPYFSNGDTEERLILKKEFDSCFQTDNVANFENEIYSAINKDGAVFNGIGYAKYGMRWNLATGDLLTDAESYYGCTGLFPVAAGDTVYVESIGLGDGSDTYPGVILFDSNFNRLVHGDAKQLNDNAIAYYFQYTETDNGFALTVKKPDTVAYMAINYRRSLIGNYPVISVNEPITYSQEGFLADGIKIKAANIKGLEAEKNQNAFSNVAVGSTTIAADSATDTLTLAGSNVTITPDATNDKVTIGITKDNVTSALGYTPPTTNTTYTSLKNPYAVTIQGNGTSLGTYDGSAAKTFNITPSNIGAYTKAEIDAYSFITTADIDTICGQSIVNASEVTF